MASWNSKNEPADRAAASTGPGRGADKRGRERGIALVAVLWVMVVLAALAASFSTSTRTQVNLARNMAEAAAAEAIADAAIARAGAGLVVPIDEGGVRTDQTVYQWPFAGGQARFVISDEGGKIDLNVASRTLIRDYLEVLGIGEADALAAAIVAYRNGGIDADPDAAEIGGADVDAYADGVGQSPFVVLEALQQVPGISRGLYARIAANLTIYSDQPDPDRKAALPAVREAQARGQGDRQEDGSMIAGADESWPPPPPGPLSILREGSFTPRSMVGVFTVHSEGRSAGGAVFVREAVLAIEYGGDRPYVIRAWRQGRRVLFAPPGATNTVDTL